MPRLKDGDFIDYVEQLQQESLRKLRSHIQQSIQEFESLNLNKQEENISNQKQNQSYNTSTFTNKSKNKVNNNDAVFNEERKQNSYKNTRSVKNNSSKSRVYQTNNQQRKNTTNKSNKNDFGNTMLNIVVAVIVLFIVFMSF